MAICYQCGTEEATRGLLCESCIALNQSRAHQVGGNRDISGSASLSRFNLGQFVRYLLFALALFYVGKLTNFFGLFGHTPLPDVTLKNNQGIVTDPCADKTYCFVMLVAPWCPHCENAVGTMESIRSNLLQRGDVGIKMIVGLDSESNLYRMANKIGSKALVDTEGKFSRSIGRTAVPAWWAVKDGAVIKRGTGFGIRGGDSASRANEFLERYMGISN